MHILVKMDKNIFFNKQKYDTLIVTSSLALTIIVLIGGKSSFSLWDSTTARIAFLYNSNKIWYKCDGV